MLLNSRMSSIPYSSRRSIYFMKEIKHLFKNQSQNPLATLASQSSTKTGLQYFNIRVTQRLHRYRYMKKQWQEVATSVQNNSSSTPSSESPIPVPDILPVTQNTIKNPTISSQKPTIEAKPYCINDYINATIAAKDHNGRNTIDLDPLHSRIQQDLIKLRKFIKTKRGKASDNISFKTPTSSRPSGETTSIGTAFDDQETNNITKTPSLNKLKPLDRVKIAGCQMRPPIIPKSESVDSGIGSTSNSSSTCSQYSKQQQETKQQNNSKTFNIQHSRVNPPPPPLPSDSFVYRPSKKKSNTSSKMTQPIPAKQRLPSPPSIPTPQVPSIVKKKQPSFIKQETPLPPIRRLSDSIEVTTRLYKYSASSSSVTPRSMILKRNTSLLPILLQSSSCMGVQPRIIRPKKPQYNNSEEESEENNNDDDDNDNDDYYHLLDYKHLINRLPKPLVSTLPRYGQDDYGLLFEQLDHIRETMPDSNVYDDYTRII